MARRTVTKPELMVGGSDAAFRRFIHGFLAFAARVGEVRTRFGEYIGLSGSAYTTLISVAHLQGKNGVGVNRIAEHLHLSGSFVSIEVGKLVKAGLVAKRSDAIDRRRVLLTVTEAGRARLAQLAAVQAPVNNALFDCLDAEDFRRFAAVIADLVPCGDRAISMLDLLTLLQPRRAGRR